jgi:sphingomyelin phosphodiesterase 2
LFQTQIPFIDIAERLVQSFYDIISLQEVWSEYDYQKIKSRISSTYPYSHYFYSGVVGSGLCIFSRHKILNSFFHHWSVNGYVHKIQHGDWFGGKGVGLCKIKVDNHIINFYIAHVSIKSDIRELLFKSISIQSQLHAEYDKTCDDYMTHRIIQAFDTAQFLENTRGDCSLQILAGDLNTEPGDLAYRILLSTSGMKDSFNIKPCNFSGTHEYIYNSYTNGGISTKAEGIRIDYILFRENKNFRVKVEEYELPFLDKIPELNLSYSDHEAVHSRLIIQETQSELSKSAIDKNLIQDNIKNLKECIATCNKSLKALDSHRRSYTMMAIGLSVLLINIVEFNPSFGFQTAYMIFKFILCGMTLFFIFMATLWNIMEKHGILAGKLSMDIALDNNEEALKA